MLGIPSLRTVIQRERVTGQKTIPPTFPSKLCPFLGRGILPSQLIPAFLSSQRYGRNAENPVCFSLDYIKNSKETAFRVEKIIPLGRGSF